MAGKKNAEPISLQTEPHRFVKRIRFGQAEPAAGALPDYEKFGGKVRTPKVVKGEP